MSFVAVMWTIWGVLVAAAVVLHLYRESISKNEDDQIYLDPAFEHEEKAQAEIVAKVNKVEPLLKIAYWLVAIMTVLVVIYYIRDIVINLGLLH
jgi:hypothetical protein